ncbi:IS1380 family transposase [Paenarthrobacter sp. Z7-10]|uniref:IS1380 family transposase n=1 Tax=Paenarthrobacter sp. Z7-10 TaxID=2787635 RepID=UPI0022A9A490|nr:IS1380 family transposase [Paenarthrobacter sp. Z7-10]MCZ2403970.1 IS1380 family transposase [Paenarthrobacter sp. Z7-10]
MNYFTGFYPSVRVDGAGDGVVSQAGGAILTSMLKGSGITAGLSGTLEPWRKPFAIHNPGKILTDLALSLATGGDAVSDVDRLRNQPEVYGRVASDPTISRLFKILATVKPAKALSAINTARAAARAHVWAHAGQDSPLHGVSTENPLTIDIDASLLNSHSEKEDARPTWKKGFGFHPLCSFIDHGILGTGEPLVTLLRPGNAGSNTAADHIQVVKDSLKQLPEGYRAGRKIMIRTDSAGGTHDFLNWLTAKHRNLSYSVGFPIHGAVADVLPLIPKNGWTSAYDSNRFERDGAWIADITGMLDLSAWPAGMRVIVRREVPHVGAQLRITDIDGHRYTAIATNQKKGQLAVLEVRHRLRARCEDRIRNAKDTGFANLPFKSFTANELWCHVVMLAAEIMAWTQMVAFTGTKARRWEPKKLRARLFEIGGKIASHARRTTLQLASTAPDVALLLKG